MILLCGAWILYLLIQALGDQSPSILSVTIISDPASPVTEGSSVRLICTVRLDVPLRHPPAIHSVTIERNNRILANTNLTSPTFSTTDFSYTIGLSRFRRYLVGNYACRMYFNASLYSSDSIRVTTKSAGVSVYVQLRDTVYNSTSNIYINDIGEGNNSLSCITDLVDCCTADQTLNGQPLGEWYYPDGSSVGIKSSNEGFYRNRDSSRVRLNRREHTTSPLGLFCCEVPDAYYSVKRICVNISSEIPSMTITSSTIYIPIVASENTDATTTSSSMVSEHTSIIAVSEHISTTAVSTNAPVGAGVCVQLRYTVYRNTSNIHINDIGEGNNSLICFTDLVDCCRHSRSLYGQPLGEWYYPNGSQVGIITSDEDFYRNRDSSRVRLNRREHTTSPLGLFCCEVPDANYSVKRICINITSEIPSITTTSATTVTVPILVSKQNNIIDTTSFLVETRADKGQDNKNTSNANMITIMVSVSVATFVVILLMAIFTSIIVVIYTLRRKKNAIKYDQPTQHTFQMASKEPPQIHIMSPHNMTITEGEGVYFKVKVNGVPQPTVTWYHDGEPVETDYAREIEEDGSLSIPSTELKHSGVYKAVVANQHGSEEREVKLRVNENGKVDAVDHTYETADSVNNHYEVVDKGTNQQQSAGDYHMTQCPVYGMAPWHA